MATTKEAIDTMAVHMANLYYFLTKEMLDAYGEGAKEVIERAIINFGHYRGREIAKRVKADGKDLTFQTLDEYYDIPLVDGWQPQRVYEKDRKYNTTAVCTQAEVWKKWNWQEIGHIYCLIDIAIREGFSEGHSPRLVFKPGKNALKGDDCCTSLTVYED